MADIREQILIDNLGAKLLRSPAIGALATTIKLALRRFVLTTANTPLSGLYRLVYRAHVWYGVRALRGLPGVRAIYVTRGVASGEIVPGISDVDFAVFGDWTDEQHAHVAAALRRLSATSPLFERELWREARTVSSIGPLYESDYSLMSRLHEGRTRWTLRHGEHVLAALPAPPDTRVAGGYYMELRLWWSYFARTAFGTGVLATDTAFRNSLCYKVVSESLAKIDALAGRPLEVLRRKALANAVARSTEHRSYLERLQASGAVRHRRFDGDIHEDTFRFLLQTLDLTHASLGAFRAFEALVAGEPPEIDASASDLPRTGAVTAHAAKLVAHVKASWPGYRAAFLVPCLSFYRPDDLVLLFDVGTAQPPTVAQVRELNRLHASASGALGQQVTLFLLLEHGAYQIETAGPLDLWHLLMCRASNPDLFHLLGKQEFVLDGTARAAVAPKWTRFAAALVAEELGVRRSAMARMSAAPSMSALDLLRNIWRHLQLEVITNSTDRGRPVLPLTPAAIQRALVPFGWLDPELVNRLKLAYDHALGGAPVDLGPLMDGLMTALAQRPSSR